MTAEIFLIGENGVPRLEVNIDHVATLRQAARPAMSRTR